jgi:hypothetical protein
MPACQQAQPSIQNAEGNLRNQPAISVTRSTAKISDRYSQENDLSFVDRVPNHHTPQQMGATLDRLRARKADDLIG